MDIYVESSGDRFGLEIIHLGVTSRIVIMGPDEIIKQVNVVRNIMSEVVAPNVLRLGR